MKNILDKSQAQLKDLLSENQEKTRQLRDLSARNEELSQSLENLNKSLEKRYKDSILENDQISLIIQNLKREISGFFYFFPKNAFFSLVFPCFFLSKQP